MPNQINFYNEDYSYECKLTCPATNANGDFLYYEQTVWLPSMAHQMLCRPIASALDDGTYEAGSLHQLEILELSMILELWQNTFFKYSGEKSEHSYPDENGETWRVPAPPPAIGWA